MFYQVNFMHQAPGLIRQSWPTECCELNLFSTHILYLEFFRRGLTANYSEKGDLELICPIDGTMNNNCGK